MGENMIFIFIIVITASIALMYVSYKQTSEGIDNDFMDFVAIVCFGISACVGSACLVAAPFVYFEVKSSEYKASIINREYNTNYTPREVFYAESVIDEIRQLDRKRIEINGNLLKK
jgi:hypothetical protein